MILLRDHYFIAWLKIVKKYDVVFSDGKIFIDINKIEYNEALIEYNNTMKPVMKEIRSLVKELANYSTNSSK
jgi:hypothetical protein